MSATPYRHLALFMASLSVLLVIVPNGEAGEESQFLLLPNDPEALVELFSPVLRLSSREVLYPVPVDAMLENANLRRDGELILEAPIPASILGTYRSTEFYLDVEDTGSGISYGAITSQYPVTVYARVNVWSEGILLQFWFFYIYNDGLNKHEGDWEVVSVLLDLAGRPKLVAYSQHYTAIVRHWTNLERIGSHPIVYVARGSHASYFSAGEHMLRSTPCGFTGLDSASGTVTVGNEDYTLVLLDEQAWLAFEGLWGEANPLPGMSGPPGPIYRRDGCGSSLWTPPPRWFEDLSPDEDFSLIPRRGMAPSAQIQISEPHLRGEPISFDALGTEDDGEIVYAEWDFGDGTVVAGLETNHSYAVTSNFTIRLTVMDDDGNTDRTRLDLEIGEPDDGDWPLGVIGPEQSVWIAVAITAGALFLIAYTVKRRRMKRH